MSPLLAMSVHSGIRFAEVGFLLMLIAGVWLAADSVLPRLRLPGSRTAVAGVLIAVGAVLVIIAIHWGHF